jgi:SAM-dependent methyltransferase
MPSSPGKAQSDFLRNWLKFPVTYRASKALAGVPMATVQELCDGKQLQAISVPPESVDRGSWNIRLDEEILIGLTVQAVGARRIFEIGTFDGSTTRVLADIAGEGAEVFTLDLPEAEFDHTQRPPPGFDGERIGTKFRGAAVQPRIKQLFGDSLKFDFSPYERYIDLVFVEGAHDYLHGLADSRTALRLVRPGGAVLWHDFSEAHPGLVHAVIEATSVLPLKRLGIYTSLGFVRTKV